MALGSSIIFTGIWPYLILVKTLNVCGGTLSVQKVYVSFGTQVGPEARRRNTTGGAKFT